MDNKNEKAILQIFFFFRWFIMIRFVAAMVNKVMLYSYMLDICGILSNTEINNMWTKLPVK